jgi:guanylate kinase
MRGLCFVVSAPAGTGKTTLVSKLKDLNPRVVQSLSYTTRKPRAGEINGLHYNFVSRKDFEEKIARGEFLEYVTLYGDYYGTAKDCVEKLLSQGRHVFMVIDTQGASLLKDKWPAVYIFISPPSLEVLRERLSKRRTESPSLIEQRLKIAETELKARLAYDYQIINDDLDKALEALSGIVTAEEHKTKNFF